MHYPGRNRKKRPIVDRERAEYAIYRLTSPSGGQYVGLTKYSVGTRWRQHLRRSRANGRHPLYDAIRSHGGAALMQTLNRKKNEG